jgi:flavin-dependent dehydrogenase
MTAARPIEIIGGGLAGLGLGLGLRARGLPVIIREAGTYPRHRVCGEFITGLDPWTRRTLALDAHLGPAQPARGVTWFETGRAPWRHNLPEPALCLARDRLDASLAAAFTAAGGELHTGQRTDPVPAEGRVLACGRRPSAGSPWVGRKQHFRRLDLHDDLELHLGDGAYVGLTRIDRETVNVCGLFPRPGSGCDLPTQTAACGLTTLAARLVRAEPVAQSACAVAGLDYENPPRAGDGLFLGDRSALIPPFTGHGMTIALQSAALAVAPLADWSLGRRAWLETTDLVRRTLQSRFGRRLTWARRLHPWLVRPARRRLLHVLSRAGLLPFDPLYRLLH